MVPAAPGSIPGVSKSFFKGKIFKEKNNFDVAEI
jgi:hypothetical protein